MKWKLVIAGLVLTAAVACNNEASVQDETDSVTHTQDSNESNWPGADDILGSDSIHSPESQTDTTIPTLKK